jgi:hypothetical protein
LAVLRGGNPQTELQRAVDRRVWHEETALELSAIRGQDIEGAVGRMAAGEVRSEQRRVEYERMVTTSPPSIAGDTGRTRFRAQLS